MAAKTEKTEATKKPAVEVKYPLTDYYDNPEVLNASKDIIRAAFMFYGVKENVTLIEAKKIVNDFKERKL